MPSKFAPAQYFSGCHLRMYEAAQKSKANQVAALSQECRIGLDASGSDDMTMLALASIRGERTAIVALVKAGADPFRVIQGAGSPAVMAINRHFDPQRIEAIAAFREAGLDFNTRLRGKPYLFYFVDYAHWQGLEYALANGGDVNAATDGGETLLSYVIGGHHLGVARILLAKGADPFLVSKFGDCPLKTLEFAIARGDPTSAEWRDQVALRSEILGRIPNGAARLTPFTDAATARIAQVAH